MSVANNSFAHRTELRACAPPPPPPPVAEIRENAVLHLGGAFDSFAMGVKQIPTLLGFEVGNPDNPRRAGQVGFANAHSADSVIIGVRFLEFAQLAALQNQSCACNGS